MSVFMEYLEESYVNATELRADQVRLYVLPLLEIDAYDGFQELMEDFIVDYDNKVIPTKVLDYFHTNFQRCGNENCNEWTRRTDLHQARYDYNEDICPSCREDGN